MQTKPNFYPHTCKNIQFYKIDFMIHAAKYNTDYDQFATHFDCKTSYMHSQYPFMSQTECV